MVNSTSQDMVVKRPFIAFTSAVPIAVLGGLIGLGGAEFRLPVLAGVLRYSARQAVTLNLAVSLVTLITSLIIRGNTLAVAPVRNLAIPILALITGAVTAAVFGTGLAKRVSNKRLEQAIFVLLVSIGGLLIVEGFLRETGMGLVPDVALWQVLVGVGIGLLIGLVSSLLGVAGGELIIPTLIFMFGADIKTAGTASLLISLPTVTVGLIRYARQGAFAERAVFSETILPMGVGSIIGALMGGLLVGLISPAILKVGLGIILIVSAWRVFHHTQQKQVVENAP